jgi:3-hydroxyacyl-CoA dehydrogenase/enoyl-CoA hydratase/3-hydroxybutyryl-CoA epimerase
MDTQQGLAAFRQFRVERAAHGLVHLVFDAPDRTMNVFSNEAIQELGAFAKWFASSDATGALIRSGKASAFCAGADLNELGVAYDTIMAAPAHERFNIAFSHFFPLSAAIRALESCGKPVAAAVSGLALGGGLELALGAHYRVLADAPAAGLGLPESLVGLLPGGGGTQRLPRLIGVHAALPILLAGERLSGDSALRAGLVNELVPMGTETAAAERWLLATQQAAQPWDMPGWIPPSAQALSQDLAGVRQRILNETLGHYPAPLAILDCVEFGMPQNIDGAIRSEMAIFSHLIQRAEPRDMIQSLFLGKGAYDRLSKRGQTPEFVQLTVDVVKSALARHAGQSDRLDKAGFSSNERKEIAPVRTRSLPGLWLEDSASGESGRAVREILDSISQTLEPLAARLSLEEQRLADYATIRQTGYPAYLGGPFAFRRRVVRTVAGEPSASSR